MPNPDLEGDRSQRAGRVVDSLVIESADPVAHSASERASRLNLDPNSVESRRLIQKAPPINLPIGDEARFRRMPAILLFSCIAILCLLYGMHWAAVGFASLATVQPALGWVYGTTLAAMIAILTRSLVRLVMQYHSVRNITDLQGMARLALSQKSVDHDTVRDAILHYSDDLQARGDAQTKSSIERLRTKFGQYTGDAGRDFHLLDELVLCQIDRKVDARLSECALHVAVATALATRFFDPLIVGVQAVQIVRDVATDYRGRPGLCGTMHLVGRATSAAIFAEVADVIADAVSQMAGIKFAAKLSARFSEGLTNGFVMVRLGEATKRLCRPIPLPAADYSHSLRKLATGLVSRGASEPNEAAIGRVAT